MSDDSDDLPGKPPYERHPEYGYIPYGMHDAPTHRFRTHVKGGRLGVSVNAWLNSTAEGVLYPTYKLSNRWRPTLRHPWRDKVSWSLVDLETLFHILRRDALPWGLAVQEGRIVDETGEPE